jgi:hypothetical protein
LATAKVTAMELRQGDEVMLYLYNDRGACARIIVLKNVGDKIELVDTVPSSKMPISKEHNKD